jgi:hypothetical protein
MKYYFTIILFLFIAYNLSSQVITGTVFDEETGEVLAGVNVILDGTILGAATNQKGEFIISDLPAEKYTVKVSMLGYINQTYIVTVNNDTTVLQIPLLISNILFDIKCDTNKENKVNNMIVLECTNYWIDETDEGLYFIANLKIINNSDHPIYILKNNFINWETFCGSLYDSTYKLIASFGHGYVEHASSPVFTDNDIIKVKKHSYRNIDSIPIMHYLRDVDYNQTLYFKVNYYHGPKSWVIQRNQEKDFKNNISKHLQVHCKLYPYNIESDYYKLNHITSNNE